MRHCALMRYYQPFPAAIPQYEAGYPRVTHPSATMVISIRKYQSPPFDLHVLGTPPAFILSQDQTLMLNIVSSLSHRKLGFKFNTGQINVGLFPKKSASFNLSVICLVWFVQTFSLKFFSDAMFEYRFLFIF